MTAKNRNCGSNCNSTADLCGMTNKPAAAAEADPYGMTNKRTCKGSSKRSGAFGSGDCLNKLVWRNVP
jgi:hypothetical protein